LASGLLAKYYAMDTGLKDGNVLNCLNDPFGDREGQKTKNIEESIIGHMNLALQMSFLKPLLVSMIKGPPLSVIKEWRFVYLFQF